jgi:predicted transcriptional regulator
MHANSFWNSYDAIVAEIVSRRASTIDEICNQLDLMRDEIEDIASRLVARGIIERNRDSLLTKRAACQRPFFVIFNRCPIVSRTLN